MCSGSTSCPVRFYRSRDCEAAAAEIRSGMVLTLNTPLAHLPPHATHAVGDFPPLEPFREILATLDIMKFPRPDPKVTFFSTFFHPITHLFSRIRAHLLTLNTPSTPR